MASSSERLGTALGIGPIEADVSEPSGDVGEYRSIFISDLHLGTLGAKAEAVNRFLKENRADRLYLLGDVLDVWCNRTVFRWPHEQIGVIRRILGLAESGVDVYYVLGNHDRALYPLSGLDIGHFHVRSELIHETADNRHVLVTHGDAYDGFVLNYEGISRLATRSHQLFQSVARIVSLARRSHQRGRLNVCRFVRVHAKRLADQIGRFAETVAEETMRRQLNGIVCGHMHRPEIRNVHGVEYYNAGDWVDNCTALVEDFNGRLDLLHYPIVPSSNR